MAHTLSPTVSFLPPTSALRLSVRTLQHPTKQELTRPAAPALTMHSQMVSRALRVSCVASRHDTDVGPRMLLFIPWLMVPPHKRQANVSLNLCPSFPSTRSARSAPSPARPTWVNTLSRPMITATHTTAVHTPPVRTTVASLARDR
jgi:hypothetical protein